MQPLNHNVCGPSKIIRAEKNAAEKQRKHKVSFRMGVSTIKNFARLFFLKKISKTVSQSYALTRDEKVE